jgi:thiosulfate reductase cytochrome b subunit
MENINLSTTSNSMGLKAGGYRIFRHSIPIRLTHWMTVICLFILLMSGLQIFNAHPALYWGQKSDFEHSSVSIGAERNSANKLTGTTNVLGYKFITTGILGVSPGADGRPAERGFPGWITLPAGQDLATGRLWHFLAAWGFVLSLTVYFFNGLATGHFWRHLVPSAEQIRHIGPSIWDHLRLRFPKGKEAEQYNVLQKLTYILIIFIVLPVAVLAGLTMSPGLDAAFPQLLHLFGGRQSARTVHFLAAGALVLFFIVHVALVLVSGVWNNMRSMITGWYTIEPAVRDHREH